MLAIGYLAKHDSVMLDVLSIGILLWLLLTPGKPTDNEYGAVPGREDNEVLPQALVSNAGPGQESPNRNVGDDRH
jgi:hypothetical protein